MTGSGRTDLSTMSNKGDSKPGFFKRLFGGSKKDSSSTSSSSRHASASGSLTSGDQPRPSHSPLLAPPVKTRTSSSGSGGGSGGKSSSGDASQANRKPRRQTSGGQRTKAKGQKHRKRTKAMIDPGAIKVYSQRLYFILSVIYRVGQKTGLFLEVCNSRMC